MRQRNSGDILSRHVTKKGMKSSQLTLTESSAWHTIVTQSITHLTTQLNLAFKVLKMVPHLRKADVSSCIFARGVSEYSRHLMSWRKLLSNAAASASIDGDTKSPWQLSESSCEAKSLSQVACGGIERSSMQTLDDSNIRLSQWLCFSTCIPRYMP